MNEETRSLLTKILDRIEQLQATVDDMSMSFKRHRKKQYIKNKSTNNWDNLRTNVSNNDSILSFPTSFPTSVPTSPGSLSDDHDPFTMDKSDSEESIISPDTCLKLSTQYSKSV